MAVGAPAHDNRTVAEPYGSDADHGFGYTLQTRRAWIFYSFSSLYATPLTYLIGIGPETFIQKN